MSTLIRVEMVGTGWTGAPAMSAFYFNAGGAATVALLDACVSDVRAAYTASVGKLVSGSIWNHNAAAKILASDTGLQVGELTSTVATSNIVATDSGAQLSRATMCKLRCHTNTYVGGRRLQGGPYIGPLGSSAITAAGQLSASVIVAAFNTLMTDADIPWVMWHRPVDGAGGVVADVESVTAPIVPSTLRSRRD